MKLGVLSQWFDPEPGPAAIPGVFAREFVRLGHEVNVLTGYPNYPQGELYLGYRQRIRERSAHDGVVLTRVPLYPNHNSSSIGRIANYASFAASAATLGAGALQDVEAMWVYNSPVTVSLPLMTHSRWGRVPYFLHVQDLWPDSLIESGMFPRGRIGDVVAAVVRRIVKATENQAAAVGVISPSVRELILERNPELDPAKIVYVPNPTDEHLFRPVASIRESVPDARDPEVFTVMYVGAIGEVQGLDVVLEVATRLLSHAEIRFSIVGDGISRARLEKLARARRLTNVEFLGRISKERVPDALARGDVQLVSLGESGFLRHTTPSKIASLLASEVPIIGHIAGDGATMLRNSGAAIVVDPGDADGLADAVLAMAKFSPAERQSMAVRGRNYYDSNLSAHVAASRVLTTLKGTTREHQQ